MYITFMTELPLPNKPNNPKSPKAHKPCPMAIPQRQEHLPNTKPPPVN